jgi:hypothetical protein
MEDDLYSKFALLISFLCLNANSSVKIFSTKYFKYLIFEKKIKTKTKSKFWIY